MTSGVGSAKAGFAGDESLCILYIEYLFLALRDKNLSNGGTMHSIIYM